MKVVLSAFGGKLTSEPMDWPEDSSGRDIYMVLDMERPSVKMNEHGSYDHNIFDKKKCRFEATHKYYSLNGAGEPYESAEIYKLVSID